MGLIYEQSDLCIDIQKTICCNFLSFSFSKASSRNTSRPGSAHSLSLDGGDTRERPRTGSIQARRSETKPGVYKETMMFG